MIVGTWPIEENIMVSSAIINMYAQFGLHEQVEVSFYETHSRNVDVWNTLMSFYVNHEFSNEVLECFKRMQLEGISPDAITYTCNLKACGNVRALGKGKELHAVTTAQHQYGKNLMIGNALIHMYGKSGLLVEAHTAFEKMLHRDMISWNTLMAGYLKHDCHAEALHCFEKIEHKGISPDAFAFCCGLKACNGTGAVDKGIEIHREIERKGFLEKDLVLGNTLIDMYAKHGFLTKAQGVFDTLPEQDKVSWNTLLAGYLKFDQPKKALNCFEQMRIHGIPADALSFSYCLRACGTIGAIEKGKQTHAEVILNGLLENDLIVGIALVDMYALCGHLETAKDLSDKLDNQDAASWNARIATYAKHEQAEKALNYFNLMQSAGFSPNAIAFACSLKACASLGDTVKGRELHCDAEMRGLLETSLLVGNALVDMYAKCGQLIKAQEAFDKLPRRDVVSWNILIASHVKYGFDSEALEHLKKMQKEGFSPDVVTFVCSLKACGHIGAIAKGIELHADIKKAGLSNNVSLGTVLIDMYAKCGFIEKAQAVFDQLQSKDVKAWNALMSGLGNDDEAMLWCFEEMQSEAIRPDAATYAFALKACGHIGLLEKGWKMHKEIKRSGWLEEEIAVGNTLIDMYAKLGWIKQAREAFESLRKRDLVSWNILICGYAQLGEATQAVVHYERMKREGIEPDSVTFVNILNACSQEGLMGEAFVWFDAMLNDYDIMPTLEHLTCMVNLLCRSGRLEMAVTITLRLPIHPSVLMWCTILAASQRLGNTKLARYAFEQVMQLDGGEVAAYVIMYNTYAGS
jgi:pentatricopeptide repeat protein